MNSSALFVTGGTGFIGRMLLARLHDRGAREFAGGVRCLARDRSATQQFAGFEIVAGDLLEPSSYREALRGCDTVIHLAAATGKAKPADYFAVNVDATRALLAECRTAGVRRFLFVSSIAATYEDKTAYYYAQSKQQAEQLVRESGLNYLILRPTLVLGPGSPISSKLMALAGLPVVPVFGSGAVRVQPVYVGDVVGGIVAMIERPTFPDDAIDLGGPEVMTIEHLLRKMGRSRGGRDKAMVHVPVRTAIHVLAWLERWVSTLPVTAGQFSAFINDSVVGQSSPQLTGPGFVMTSLDDMLRASIHRG